MLLRAAFGAIVIYQSGIELITGSDAIPGAWIADLLLAAAGILLIIGLITPFAAATVCVIEIVTHSFLNPASCSLPACALSTVLAAAIGAAIAILGPGGFSVDARLFGLREIIIPTPRSGQSPDRRSGK